MDVRTYDEVVDEEGWGIRGQIHLLRRVITEAGLDDRLNDLAREEAQLDAEAGNEGCN